MKWEEIRETYPDQYVVLKTLEYHINGNKKYIDDMAIVRIIQDPKEATRVLVRSKGDTFVYHTAKLEVVMEIVMNPVLRSINKNGCEI